jgi:hypothetical protein
VNSDVADSHLPMPTGGGGDAAPADSGADASVRLAGRTSSTQLTVSINVLSVRDGDKMAISMEKKISELEMVLLHRFMSL